MENTESNIKTDISLLLSLFKFFAMFQIHLLYHEHDEEEHVVGDISIHCSKFHRNSGLHLNDKTVE